MTTKDSAKNSAREGAPLSTTAVVVPLVLAGTLLGVLVALAAGARPTFVAGVVAAAAAVFLGIVTSLLFTDWASRQRPAPRSDPGWGPSGAVTGPSTPREAPVPAPPTTPSPGAATGGSDDTRRPEAHEPGALPVVRGSGGSSRPPLPGATEATSRFPVPTGSAPPPTPAPPATSAPPPTHALVGKPWWEAPASPARSTSSKPTKQAPTLPPSRTLRALAGYEHPTQLAVCPECAGYALDIAAQGNRYGFRCQTCRAHWDWRPGEGWPPVRSPGS